MANTRGAARQRRTTTYISGTAARQLSTERSRRVSRDERLQVHKNRERAFYMNLPYLLFLTASMVVAGIVLCSYIQLRSEVTNQVKRISALQQEYNEIKLANDEEYARITRSINLEEIKATAIGEYGMHYAEDGQIVIAEDTRQDYVYQVADLPEDK